MDFLVQAVLNGGTSKELPHYLEKSSDTRIDLDTITLLVSPPSFQLEEET